MASLVKAVLLVFAVAGASLASASQDCLYVANQRRQGVYVYIPFETESPNTDPCKQRAFVRTEPFPTGVVIHEGVLYVATYGKVPTPPPAVHMFSLADDLSHAGDLLSGDELTTCFPEDLAVAGRTLFVACGAQGRVLMYDINTRHYTGALATSLQLPAIWGLEVHAGYLYFSSHCTYEQIGGQNYCDPIQHDKIFRVPLHTLKDEAITEFARGPQPDEAGHEPMGHGHHACGFGGLAFGPDNRLYVTSSTHNDIARFEANGKFVDYLKYSDLENPADIAFGGYHKHAYISNPGRGQVAQWDADGEHTYTFANVGPPLNSALTYLTWGPCPARRRTEL